MKMPLDFKLNKDFSTDDDFLIYLIQNPEDLQLFFVAAANDSTWLESNSKIIKNILSLLTDYHMAGVYPKEFFFPFIQIIQKYTTTLKGLVPLDLHLTNKNINSSTSSLLLGYNSFYFQRLYANVCRHQKVRALEIVAVDYYQFKLIEEAVFTGNIENLWREESVFLWNFIATCKTIDLKEVVALSEEVLKRYIDRENVLDTLLKAHKEGLPRLKNECIDFVNSQNLGIVLGKVPIEYLALDFENFKERSFVVYEKLKNEITHLGFSLDLMQEDAFIEVLEKAPKLIALNLSDTKKYSEKLKELPSKIKQLTLNRCKWLNNIAFDDISKAIPDVTFLDISSNDHLNYAMWVELSKFKKLQHLNVSRCYQINDDELRMILVSASQVIDFEIDSCNRVSTHIFYELPKFLPYLEILNVARTSIDDAPLIDILTNCKRLISLDLSRCDNISEKGLITAIKNNLILKKIILRGMNLSNDTIDQIKKIRPYLIIEL